MRIVVGIDLEHYSNALSMLNRLQPNSADVHLVHVVESYMGDKELPELGPNHPISIILAEDERLGEAELAKAAAMLEGSNYRVQTEVKMGDPSRTLIESAVGMNADLIAVGSAQKGVWASLFFGSVTKALTSSATSSILVAKNTPSSTDGLSGVMAVDHSEYCLRCIDQLLSWDMKGLRRMTVVTALDKSTLNDTERQGIEGDPIPHLTARNAELCAKFERVGLECNHRVIAEHPNGAIDAAMEETGADLLIVGARGHGFWDRLGLGSISHHQVVATPHNVLVIRSS